MTGERRVSCHGADLLEDESGRRTHYMVGAGIGLQRKDPRTFSGVTQVRGPDWDSLPDLRTP